MKETSWHVIRLRKDPTQLLSWLLIYPKTQFAMKNNDAEHPVHDAAKVAAFMQSCLLDAFPSAALVTSGSSSDIMIEGL